MSKEKKWTRELYAKYIKEMHEGLVDAHKDAQCSDMECDIGTMASEVAMDILSFGDTTGDYPKGLKKFLESLGVIDVDGRLTDDIYSGNSR